MRDQVREQTIAVLRETGATALIVTHDPQEAMSIADRIALMRAGRLVQVAPAREIYENPVDLEAARFFCDLNEVEARVSGGRIETPLGIFAAPGRAEGEIAVAAVRPQSIRLKPAGFCLPGRVIARRFIGEAELVDIVVEGLDRPRRARLAGSFEASPGTDIGVDIAREEVLVF
jgi:iron(III) transport system ATP-binding protein